MNACLFMDRYKKAKMNHKLSSSRNDPERNNPLHNFKVHVGIHYITWYYPFNSGQFSWLYSSRGSSSRIKRTHKADYDIISGRILDNLESCINPMNFNKSKKRLEPLELVLDTMYMNSLSWDLTFLSGFGGFSLF